MANPFLEKNYFFENIEHDLDLPYLPSTSLTDFNFSNLLTSNLSKGIDGNFPKEPLSIDDLNFDFSKQSDNNNGACKLTESIDTDYLADENNFAYFDDFFKYTKDLVTQNNENFFPL